MEVIKIGEQEYELVYYKEDLKEKGIDFSKITPSMAKRQPQYFHNEFTKLQYLVGQDIIDHKLFEKECCCMIEPYLGENSEVIAFHVAKAEDPLLEEGEKKEELPQNELGFTYLKIPSMESVYQIPDRFAESSVLKLYPSGEYVLRVKSENKKVAELILCEHGQLIDPPKNWDVVIKENAIKKIKSIKETV